MEPAHSPFGLIGQIARDTGWSVNYIKRGVNYPMLMLMWQDFPRHVEGRKKSNLEILREMEAEESDVPSERNDRNAIAYLQQLEKEEEECNP